MKNKKLIAILLILFVAFTTINVEASIYDGYLTIEKSEDSGELYNLMPTEVKKGDIISVKMSLPVGPRSVCHII